MTYRGVDGNPVLSKEGIAKTTYTYDARGNETARTFLGVDG